MLIHEGNKLVNETIPQRTSHAILSTINKECITGAMQRPNTPFSWKTISLFLLTARQSQCEKLRCSLIS